MRSEEKRKRVKRGWLEGERGRERDGDSWKERAKLVLSNEDNLCHVVGERKKERENEGAGGRRRERERIQVEGNRGYHVSATKRDSTRVVGGFEKDGDTSKRDEEIGEKEEYRRSDKDERIGEGWVTRGDSGGGTRGTGEGNGR